MTLCRPALLSLSLMRMWLLSRQVLLQDDPIAFALKDRISLAPGLLVAITFALAIKMTHQRDWRFLLTEEAVRRMRRGSGSFK